MTCNTCKFYVFNQNDMLGACKLNPVVVNKAPTDWCGQEQQKKIEPSMQDWIKASNGPIQITPIIEKTNMVYDINTDEVKPKRGRKNAGKQE